MWSALQTLHKVSSKAREHNFFLGGVTHDWVEYYENRIESDRSCLNEWHAMDSIESRRPPSPDSVRSKPREREETEKVIRCTLKEIMMSVDLDEVTSKHIRSRLEDQLDMDLTEYKSFIDHEMLTILGQMDAATEIFDHVYLGSEWNASNLEELQKNGVHHILNVTREIDNFFPGMFNYLNVRVYDDEKTDLLKHWDNTYKYITRARKEGSKVLVHCKMGVSRSASVVIAYAMKAYNWDFKKALDFVRQKRTCIKPNTSFVSQLEMYQGILDAMKNKEKLQRSKSETNLKSPGLVAKAEATSSGTTSQLRRSGPASSSSSNSCDPPVRTSPKPAPQSEPIAVPGILEQSGKELASCGGRPKSWSPDNTLVSTLFSSRQPAGPTSVSLEHLNSDGNVVNTPERDYSGDPSAVSNATLSTAVSSVEPQRTRNYNGNVRMPCGNGLMYSVSQNKVVHLPGSSPASANSSPAPLVKQRVTQLETAAARASLALNFNNQFEADTAETVHLSASVDATEEILPLTLTSTSSLKDSVIEKQPVEAFESEKNLSCRKPEDPFSNQLDLVFEREEQKRKAPVTPTVTEGIIEGSVLRDCPSRQSSWSSYDSAVVLREAPSRQSSWGSGDTRWGALPSRNSSWGSYDIRTSAPQTDKDDITWHPGSVRRTRHRIEEGKEDNEVASSTPLSTTTASLRLQTPRPYLAPSLTSKCSVAKSPQDTKIVHYASSPTLSSHGSGEDDVLGLLGSPPSDKIAVSQPNITFYHGNGASPDVESLLSVSAPAATSLCLVPGMRFSPSTSDNVTELPGKVKNLKMEFEAKSSAVSAPLTKDGQNVSVPNEKVRSLPSSPVSVHSEREPQALLPSPLDSPASSAEDLSVKVLVGKYEVGKVSNGLGPMNLKRTRILSENEVPRKASQPPIPPRKSSFDVQNNTTSLRHSSLLVNNLRNGGSCVNAGGGLRVVCPAPTKAISSIPSPSVVMASVVAKANNKKQQQGKTHPLARLAISKVPRHTNPVYNTM